MAESGDKYVLRSYEAGDYKEYISWWDDVPPDEESLPPMGLVCGDMKAVGFLVNTDTDFCIFSWWYASPKNKGRESYMALKKVMMGLVDLSILLSKQKVFVYTDNRGMIRLLESLGFINHNGHLVRFNGI